ncbi:hypothetical protein NQ314_017353 [Rhamnusium bicolor]|uniref:CUE domain-containing protein n=1 Tax=Rhamnusium bicolor TaxID=1586634 RepID=A0AAV8WT42_9CUCU|nr:hypothetical protein NQ314_017353 [Rhamnusium bicolor]
MINCQMAPLSTPLKATYVAPKMSKKASDIDRAIKYIQKGYKVLIIMRGVPGCGKSYLAKNILQSTVGFNSNSKLHILSSDDFFCQNGVYKFDSNKLQDAHGWNHNRAFQALSRGFSPVIIDNTNTQMWEMKPYAMMATDYGYIIEILEPDTHWCFNDKELAKRNSHCVPRATIKDMIDRYDKNITPQKLLSAYNLTYRLQKPPQLRLYPPLNISNSMSTNSLSNKTGLPENYNFEANNMKSKSVSVLNIRPLESKTESVEMINLMDFNDDETSQVKLQPVVKMRRHEMILISQDQNPVDDILMCSNGSENENSSVLLPSQQNETDVIMVESSDEENEITQADKKIFLDLETAWGINENALRSWDIVTPITDDGNFTNFSQYSTSKHQIITKDSSCNTEEEYFQLLRNKQIDANNSVVKVLDTLNRDINRTTPKREPILLKKSMHDKSCLTEDIFEDYENHMSQLVNLFPSVPKRHLNYWYNKCRGDLEWTIEFLLEAKEEISTLIEDSNVDTEQVNVKTDEADSDSSNSNQTGLVNCNERKIKRNRNSSDESKELKKIIESKVDINDEHYSKHLLKIKQLKFGNSNGFTDNSIPSTSANNAQFNNSSNISQPSNPKSYISKEGSCMTNAEEVVVIVDSDMEFDDSDGEENNTPEQIPEETTELNLGDSFVAQLEEKFGDPNMTYPKGFQPVVQVPITLARQLYTFYIESVYQQMETQKQVLETLIREDEEFARNLQAKEEENVTLQPQVQSTSTIPAIMDEQVAQGIYQKETDKWKDLNPDNLAAKLTRQKLFTTFPTIDKDTLIEILYAHDNKYQDTVETLLASTRQEDVRGNPNVIKEPPLREEVIAEMKEAQKNSTNQEYVDQQAATFYREEANKYLKKRAELYQKAQQYQQRGMNEVAQFYSGLASQQTIYFDRANNIAATTFLDEHSKRFARFQHH